MLLWRRRIAIAMAGLICACAAVMIGKSLTPRYAATAQLYVDPRELQLVDRELTPRAQDISGLAMVVESQARLITSNSVLLQVIQDTNLDKDPEFGGDVQEHDGVAARPVRDRDPFRRRSQARPDGGAGSPEPPHQRQEDRPHLHRRHRRLVVSTRPRRRCSPTRSPTPIWRNPRNRRPPPRGARPPTCRAG